MILLWFKIFGSYNLNIQQLFREISPNLFNVYSILNFKFSDKSLSCFLFNIGSVRIHVVKTIPRIIRLLKNKDW